MEALLAGLVPKAMVFMLIVTRLSGLMMMAPVFGSRTVPPRIKAGLIILLAYLSLPLVPGPATPPDSVITFALLAAKELLVGLAFGLIAQLVFAAIQFAGQLIDTQSGFGFMQVVDPTSNVNVSVLGKFYDVVAVTAFVTIGGHQMLVGGLMKTFQMLPPLSMPRLSGLTTGVLHVSEQIILVALEVAAPVLVALFVADVAFGLVARAVPQMNVFIVGMPVKIALALGGVAVLMPTTVGFFNELTGRLMQDLSNVFQAASP